MEKREKWRVMCSEKWRVECRVVESESEKGGMEDACKSRIMFGQSRQRNLNYK